jgi:anti-sigma regulatory factor (Ser/Thr protein kinase)
MEEKFHRDLASLDRLFEFVSVFADRHNLGDDTAFDIKLVIEETFTNLVKYDSGADTEIPISLRLKGRQIEIVVVNTGGSGFDITKSAPIDMDAPLQERKTGGLGLHLIKRLVDNISYEYADGTGVIRIIKDLEDNRAGNNLQR